MKTRTFTITGLPENQYEWLLGKATMAGVSISSYLKLKFSEEMRHDNKKSNGNKK